MVNVKIFQTELYLNKKEWRKKLDETTETVLQVSQPKMQIKIIERLGSRLQIHSPKL